MVLRMDKEKYGSYELSEEEREEIKEEIIDLLEDYSYDPTDFGVDTIIDEWIQNKGWMINLFKKHPNYNGKFQIAFDSDYPRTCNKSRIVDFGYWLEAKARELRKEKSIGAFSYQECYNIYRRLDNICDYMQHIENNGYPIEAKGRSLEETKAEKEHWRNKIREYQKLHDNGEIYLYDNAAYDRALWNMYKAMLKFAEIIEDNTDHIATEGFASKVNQLFPNVKAVAGQKVSRIVNKVYTFSGLPVDREYNQEYAKYSDALNPLMIKRHTVLSCHPVDYLTMSFGNSWASCHTIDKCGRRDMPDNYSGCYSSGTLSYMLDDSSFVYYTVDKEYNGNEYELQDKINRNMFHMGEDKLIQARVYPQVTDGDTGIYRQIREIAHKVIADCLEVPNLWKNVKGTSECESVISSSGTHYKDYTHFNDCNVSYLKDETETINRNIVKVGHYPICPSCGKTHNYQEAIECEECFNDSKVCYACECSYSEEDMHYINGRWYCEDCCFYCEYHEEWETNRDESTYIENYGRVCDDAIEDSGDFFECEGCGEIIYRYSRIGEDAIDAEDGNTFCSVRCAEEAGYSSTSTGEWYPEDEIHYCEHCGNDVHDDDWNEELECCTDCEEEVREQNESENEESEAV